MALRRYLREFRPPVDESVLTDVADRLDDQLFWPAYLLSVGGSRTAALAFGVDPADVEEYTEELHRPDTWPYLTVQLARGHRLHILFRNFEDDSGWDYLLQPPGSDAVITLATLEGGFQGPALSWPELVVSARQPDPTRNWAERLLLLLPAVGDADLPGDAEEQVAEAFTAVGGQPQFRSEVAAELLTASGRFWGAPAWAERAGQRFSLGSHSPRGAGSTPDRLALTAEAFSSEN